MTVTVKRVRVSLKGSLLERGEATRRAIFAALPGSTRDVAHKTKLAYYTVAAAMLVMERRGEIECIGEEPAKPVARRVFDLAQAKTPDSESPWYNAWYARRPTVQETQENET